ncbi:CRISPR type III-associated RAMP protein [Propionibacterium ruminifibrarum]|uniref:CRISPR type III-associated RAMP protein n=1 Tax=Propionibacterium ruminifibrarum TaxID=1962131 RepID=A0A375I3F1_9ACTN|nr:RAMP superfamily CRISPR-associated protein [Propionibacterium ruminifibrarum]SPF69428.1 CRISPR type III-associated RAMP protein [Propionibacterium ruminifibrarum]
MSRTSAPPQPGALEFPVTVVFRSDWGVGTGTGIAGGVNSVVEKDANGRPVVRGTVLAGVVREQAATAARALDEAPRGPWHDFTTALFGTPESPRLVSFTDATVPDDDPDVAVHEVVSLSIDETTGTAKNDFLRFFERAAACTLRGRVSLSQTDLRGRPLTWEADQREGAELILALSGLLVRGIGSNRSDGDGLCDVLIRDAVDAPQAREWCRTRLKEWTGPAPTPPTAADRGFTAPLLTPSRVTAAGDPGFVGADLVLRLLTPVVSYEVPLSNEVRSLDFLRGTVLLPWVHRRLRRAFPDDEMVRDAVVAGDLLVSDATVMAQGVRGLPAPLVLTRPKTPDQGSAVLPMRNPLFGASSAAKDADGAQVPVRSGYVFPGVVPADAPAGMPSAGSLGAPALVGRQSTAHDPATGAASQGRLFLVRALPAGLRMGASVLVSQRLHEHLGERLHEAFPAGEPVTARLGSRRMGGSYGRVECRAGDFVPARPDRPAWDGDGATTLWFTSDVLARSGALGPGGTVSDLLAALGRGGADVELARAEGALAAGVRHRRVDSWSAADQQPRATRVAARAGSVLRVQPVPGADPGAVIAALARLSVTGFGELTAQGFGRFVLGHELLGRQDFGLTRLSQQHLLSGDGNDQKAGPTAEGGLR